MSTKENSESRKKEADVNSQPTLYVSDKLYHINNGNPKEKYPTSNRCTSDGLVSYFSSLGETFKRIQGLEFFGPKRYGSFC